MLKEKMEIKPVLFIIFNRPDTSRKVFNAIKQAKPKQLFVAADGHRENKQGEAEKCQATRDIIRQVDWDCEVKTLFREKNLGCKIAVSSSITWFFQNVEEGIILEDDCLPNESFFHFCSVMLEYYRNDNRVGFIAGTNYLTKIDIDSTYVFSLHRPIWGWATWRRAWEKYDDEMKKWIEFRNKGYLQNILKDKRITEFYYNVFEDVYNNNLDTWDHRWSFTCLVENWLTIIPKVNLVSNIGFNEDSTHTKEKGHPFENLVTCLLDISNINHPNIFSPNQEIEQRLNKLILSVMTNSKKRQILNKLFRRRLK